MLQLRSMETAMNRDLLVCERGNACTCLALRSGVALDALRFDKLRSCCRCYDSVMLC